MTETIELKPCPFCGQSMIEIEGFSNRMQKHMGHPDNGCFLAGSRVIVSRHEFDQERVIAWNTRSDPAVRDREWVRDTAMNVMLATEVEEAIRILTAALRTSPPEPASGWRPIETAPKDGSSVLLHWPNIPAGAKSLGSTSKRFTGTSVGWFEASESGVGFVCEGDHAVPLNQEDCTHWQPLPPPPAKEPQ